MVDRNMEKLCMYHCLTAICLFHFFSLHILVSSDVANV